MTRRGAAAALGVCGLAVAACAPQPVPHAHTAMAPEAAGPRHEVALRPRLVALDRGLDRIVGAGPAHLVVLLGEPTLIWRNPSAQVWQYAGDSCVLHVYLYEDPADHRYRIAHVEAVERESRPGSGGDCAEQLLNRTAARLDE